MTITERRTYLGRMHERYRRADRLGRGQLLDEMETVTGMHRKSLLRLLHAPTLRRQPRTQQRAKSYGAPVDDARRVIWESLDYICAERRTPVLVLTAQQLAAHGELVVTDAVLGQLHHISVASVQLRLTRFGQDTPRLPCRGSEQANRVARGIPVRMIAWHEATPGILKSIWCITVVRSRRATTSTRSK